MIIGVDLDGVCAEYYAGLRLFIAEEKNITPEEALELYPEPVSYNMDGWPGFPDEFLATHTKAVSQGLYTRLAAIKGASETLWRLSDEGHHIRIITSRFVSHGQNGTVIAQTAKWLDKNRIPYRDLMFVRHKPDVFADVYIDDAPENIFAFQKRNHEVIIYDTLYNQHIEGRHAKNWGQVYTHITNLNKELERKKVSSERLGKKNPFSSINDFLFNRKVGDTVKSES